MLEGDQQLSLVCLWCDLPLLYSKGKSLHMARVGAFISVIIDWPKMAGEAESEGLYLRLPVFHGAVTGLVYAPEVDAVIISTIAGSILVYDASSFKLLFENST